MNQEIFFENIIEYCNISSQYKIKELSKLINRKKRQKYPSRNEVKYGNLSKFLKKEEFEFILSFEIREKIILAYEFMYNMGLRVSEVCEIKETDIIQDQLIIRNIKGNRNDTLPIPLNLLNKLKKHIDKNKRKIRKSDDFIFYSESRSKVRKNISKDWLRNNWRKLVKLAEKQFVYDKSKEIGRKERNLNLYSSHCLRHSFGKRFYEKCKDPELTRIAMRHNDIYTTMRTYCRGDLNKVNELMLEM